MGRKSIRGTLLLNEMDCDNCSQPLDIHGGDQAFKVGDSIYCEDCFVMFGKSDPEKVIEAQ